jgi:hypothetical protein
MNHHSATATFALLPLVEGHAARPFPEEAVLLESCVGPLSLLATPRLARIYGSGHRELPFR